MTTLLRFTIENFRSIAERKTMSFIPTAIKDDPISNIAQNGVSNYLKTAAIYGANSSGKSNFIKAINMMERIVLNSVKMNDDDELPSDPYLLSSGNNSVPTLYEIEFITEGIHYCYGFSNTTSSICDEWLTRIEDSGSTSNLFIRTTEGIGVNEKLFPEGKDLEERTNDNRLFISLVGQLGGEISNSIIRFFKSGINVLSGLETDPYNSFSKLFLNRNLPGCDNMKSFFDRVKLGFSGIASVTRDFDIKDLPGDMPNDVKISIAKELSGQKHIKVFSSHGIYDENGNLVGTKSFDFENMESSGTQKLFDMAGPLFDTLYNGSVLIVDELDAKMHPLISQEIVSLFNDPLRNPHGAQLIFTTHDTTLLSSHLLRRDQIWFTEKDPQERTDVYNMMQIVLPDGTKPRGDGNLEKNYIRGRYGAIPYILPYNV